MAQYVCTVCGYVYDEEKEGILFDALPDTWQCPLCGAAKGQFEKKESVPQPSAPVTQEKPAVKSETENDKVLSNDELHIVFTNLAKGCEKQYLSEESALFTEIADYYRKHRKTIEESTCDALSLQLNRDLSELYPDAFSSAKADGDRGALRALTWSEKVSKIVATLLERYKREGIEFLANTKIFVCEICGFMYIGEEAPDVCPICKVPKMKIHEVRRA